MDTTTHPTLGRMALLAGGAALALVLAGCDRADNKTAGQQLDTAIAKTEQAVLHGGLFALAQVFKVAAEIAE